MNTKNTQYIHQQEGYKKDMIKYIKQVEKYKKIMKQKD